jgi:PAS domain S-box-containing protein
MYLERYMSTGIKRVVDTTRQVTAQKRNGDQFPCEITVREVRVEGSERSFVGFIRNLSQQHADEASAKTNSKIMDLMTTPLIVISDIGTIEEANPAAADTFGYKQQALIGGNIKMLMPQSIAENHDEYLANYLKTGKKHVLDQKRVVTALHSDGTEFPIEVNVRENIVKELNKRTYFGFLRDLRQDLQLKYAFHLNESITEMTNTPIIAIDTAGVVIKFSRAAAMVFGYDPQEVLGNNVSMLMPESYAVNHDSYLANYLVTRKKTVVDSIRRVPGKRKNGTTFQAELRVCEYTKSGGFTTYVAFFKDVTDDDRNSQDRLVSEAVAAMSNLAVIVADKRGVIGQVNDSSCELFRYSREEMIGQNVKMLMPRQYAMHHDNYLEAYQRTKVKHVIDTTRRAQALKKGDISFDMEIGVRELELDGVGTRYLGFVRDITTEVALEESSKLSSAIVSLSPVPIVVMDHIGTVMQFSDLAAVQFGYQKDEVLGRNVKMLMPQAIADKHDEYLATYMRTGVKAVVDSSRVATARKKNGTTFSAEISVREIVATDGSKYFTGFIKPV